MTKTGNSDNLSLFLERDIKQKINSNFYDFIEKRSYHKSDNEIVEQQAPNFYTACFWIWKELNPLCDILTELLELGELISSDDLWDEFILLVEQCVDEIEFDLG